MGKGRQPDVAADKRTGSGGGGSRAGAVPEAAVSGQGRVKRAGLGRRRCARPRAAALSSRLFSRRGVELWKARRQKETSPG